ncbi:hypothetical protein KNU78_gp03 [Gordonia phage Sukkupi]|uniref:Uncharacterized protein n=1 Tax=Gordonia phage Sukkupi TaxID=2653747 RepID=A0A5Q2WK94_9CAUD|nr:hypothetical protein KNU78_gp03 [Gordonia phage Sukkupi]QGH79246.1 hypothetical protein SEA_SUKKUPI_3 [Gordonia phage Sukkupi]QGH80719.1 hypothetical protein SEA_YNDEXA_3 [Gordonia phage Yndexa]
MAHDAPFPGPTIVTIKCAAAAPVIQGPSGCPKIGIRIEPGENRRKKIESEMAKEPFSKWMPIPSAPQLMFGSSAPIEIDWLCDRHAEEFRTTGSLRLASGAMIRRSEDDEATVRIEKTATPVQRFVERVEKVKHDLRELIEADDAADRVEPEADEDAIRDLDDEDGDDWVPPTDLIPPTPQRMTAAENEIHRLKETVLGDEDNSVESRLSNLEDLVQGIESRLKRAEANITDLADTWVASLPKSTSTPRVINDRIEISVGELKDRAKAAYLEVHETSGLSLIKAEEFWAAFSAQLRKYS